MTSLESLYLAAWIEGLKERNGQPAVRPAAAPGRPRGTCYSGYTPWCRYNPACAACRA